MNLNKSLSGSITSSLASVFIMCLMFMFGVDSVAQDLNMSNHTSSPYNRYGYGRLGSMGNSVNRSMGDVSVAVRSSAFTNVANPASLTAIDTLTMIFSTGLDGQYSTLTEGDLTEHSWDAGFSYMSFHFPLWKDFAMSLSLNPYSSVGYYYGTLDKESIQSSINKHDTLSVASTYNGLGGVNNFMMGIGWRFLHSKMYEASFGVNAGFLFGTIHHDATLTTSSQATGTYVSHEMDVRGLLLGFGLQYTHRFNARRGMTFGATFQPSLDLNVDTHEMKYSTDTVQVSQRYRGEVKTPMKFGVGLTYEVARQLLLSAEFEQTQWSKVTGFNADMLADGSVFDDVNRFAVGMEYIPRVMSRSYFQTCRYRMGFSTQNHYARIKDESLREFSLTAGMSLPVNKRSALDLGVGYRHLSPSKEGMLKEDYVTFTLGITFNEMMFFRNKLR